MFDTVLVANRGEIACRIIATLHELGVRAVAVYSHADADAPHVRAADEAVHIGGNAPAESYLAQARILDAARRSGAQAIHPGYGFLSENATFSAACTAAGVTFVGPPSAAIEAMGDKIRAKATVEAAGVPVVPGVHRPGLDDAALAAAAGDVGYPLLVKAAAGGGGKGMRVVHEPEELAGALAAARREAAAAFGDDDLLLERYLARPRHIEIQVLADSHGAVVHLGERECSLQRRYQKVVEECPSPALDAATRNRMGAAAIAVARVCGYTGAGTVEFILPGDEPAAFFFLEMNTRLQVEHPVTELVYGVDLVAEQLRVAAGEPLAHAQADLVPHGHAVEARVYAEDPARGFLPTGGRILRARQATGSGCRVDSGIADGTVVGSVYDPLLAKVIAHGPDRAAALRRLDAGLADFIVLGVTTNVAFLRALLAHPDVQSGRLDTGLIDRSLPALVNDDVDRGVVAAAGLARLLELQPAEPATAGPFGVPTGWRVGDPAWARFRVRTADDQAVNVAVRGVPDAAEVAVGDGAPQPAEVSWEEGHARLRTVVDGRRQTWDYATDGDVAWLGRDGRAFALREQDELAAARHGDAETADGQLLAPMPGTVTVVHVREGEAVTTGQALLVVEAMKMEHAISAPVDGEVTALHVVAGQPVAMAAPLVTVTAVTETAVTEPA